MLMLMLMLSERERKTSRLRAAGHEMRHARTCVRVRVCVNGWRRHNRGTTPAPSHGGAVELEIFVWIMAVWQCDPGLQDFVVSRSAMMANTHRDIHT